MTRFARAKGSKASNERLPEEATPWSEMKQQLLGKNKEIAEAKKRQAVINQRHANYKAFLDEKDTEERTNSQWAEFPSENIKKKDLIDTNNNESDDEMFSALKAKVDEVLEKTENRHSNNDDNDSDAPPEEQSSKVEVSTPPVKIKKPKKKLLSIVDKLNGKNVDQKKQIVEETVKNVKTNTYKKNTKNESQEKTKKRELDEDTDRPKIKKKKSATEQANKKEKVIKENLTEKDLKKIEKKKQKRIKQLEKKKRVKEELKIQKEEEEKKKIENGETTEDKIIPKNTTPKKIIKKPINKEHTRKKPFLPTKMFINGKEIEIDYVDGFPVKKEDAGRLKKLRKEMISKGLPRSEINVALKLERRKAEKAFSREKKKVCFNCRKSGHNLSECPELEKDQVVSQNGTGICFKCGSTEHTHYECKVVKEQEFKFAQCFVCNEQGHIARQCPDNARGLYPKGGACRVCGDVTHLKKDCPQYQAQQQHIQNSLNVETIGISNPDVLDDKKQFNSTSLGNRRPNKIIKF